MRERHLDRAAFQPFDPLTWSSESGGREHTRGDIQARDLARWSHLFRQQACDRAGTTCHVEYAFRWPHTGRLYEVWGPASENRGHHVLLIDVRRASRDLQRRGHEILLYGTALEGRGSERKALVHVRRRAILDASGGAAATSVTSRPPGTVPRNVRQSITRSPDPLAVERTAGWSGQSPWRS